MGSENALWDAVRGHLSPFGQLLRVECPIQPGMSDVYYALMRGSQSAGQGWIELKHVHEAPKRPKTPVRYKYEPGQPGFLYDMWRLRGHAYVLAQVGREYLLHEGDQPTMCGVGTVMPMDRLRSSARYAFKQPWTDADTNTLLRIFTNKR